MGYQAFVRILASLVLAAWDGETELSNVVDDTVVNPGDRVDRPVDTASQPGQPAR
jgi:hypothetical protein